MARIKGTRYATMRKLIRERGPEFEIRFMEKLDPRERERLQTLMPVSWVDLAEIPEKNDIIAVAAEMFFPGQDDGVQQVAAMLAQENLNGIYRIFMQIPSVEFAVKRVAKVWRTYNDRGEASAEFIGPKRGLLVVRGFPEMPRFHRVYITGYTKGVMELTRAKNVEVQLRENDPEAWAWEITYQ